MTDGSVRFLKELFQVFMEDTRRLPPQYQDKLRAAAVGDEGKARVVADYVAGMTDRYALREHARLVGTGNGD